MQHRSCSSCVSKAAKFPSQPLYCSAQLVPCSFLGRTRRVACASVSPVERIGRGNSAASPPLTDPDSSTKQAKPYGSYDKEKLYESYSDIALNPSHPMYVPVLTDEDLAKDPVGHKSGYVAVIGRPNAGKSTLINALVGQKLSIVTYKPQTTRQRIVGIASDTEYQLILFDTPGIIASRRNKLEERMMAAVVSSIKSSEAIVAVVDSEDEPKTALEMFQPGTEWDGPPMAVLLNKTDLLSAEAVEELSQWYKTNCRAEAVFIGSALNNSGIDALKKWAVSKLPEGPTLYPKDMVSEQPERFFVAELIREQIFLLYSQEIPYCAQVQIKEFKERPNAKDYISAEILVERQTQVGIIVGKDGASLKQLGSQARQAIEDFLERKVYLELSVGLSKDWREDKGALKDFGFYEP